MKGFTHTVQTGNDDDHESTDGNRSQEKKNQMECPLMSNTWVVCERRRMKMIDSSRQIKGNLSRISPDKDMWIRVGRMLLQILLWIEEKKTLLVSCCPEVRMKAKEWEDRHCICFQMNDSTIELRRETENTECRPKTPKTDAVTQDEWFQERKNHDLMNQELGSVNLYSNLLTESKG